MPPTIPASTIGAPSFDPSTLLDPSNPLLPTALSHLQPPHNDLRLALLTLFSLPASAGDTYTYHATASVTLPQVQSAVAAGPAHGLLDWYVDASGHARGQHPPPADVAAYVGLFDATKAPAAALKGFAANAKRGSLREGVAKWLTTRRFVAVGVPAVAKLKADGNGKWYVNPYAEFLAWACGALQWCGPDANAGLVRVSHHVLPLFMHHFGCVCPNWEALSLIAWFARPGAKGRPKKRVLDVGSGNGYWTAMLRMEPWGLDVTPVDNMQSRWRTVWVGDTLVVDAVKWLQKREVALQREEVLLLVYPVTQGGFTEGVIDAFKGDVVVVAGTQNGSGYTGFQGECVDTWFKKRGGWDLCVRVPLMSFPGKDDALFIFRRKDAAA
ncbi:uncharacterized protein HMPREF1541_03603 [Cyphellophora europaea CBS 101466]|uniref:Uncharacterized protein n=1 Tax=Cyphellophora europaea (strain CBS 101466) TaxID=1220924 RepID=W2RYY4_CYPE1|nr:uncharacterized protein HMPREF1541_03603 [Cyphellophora europaea CBS 101466]ETN41667.1 hypothetical protein HMPREF1541_03603 [Cyphellophora europaea CBS 101466]